jgi:hypothetical protein
MKLDSLSGFVFFLTLVNVIDIDPRVCSTSGGSARATLLRRDCRETGARSIGVRLKGRNGCGTGALPLESLPVLKAKLPTKFGSGLADGNDAGFDTNDSLVMMISR